MFLLFISHSLGSKITMWECVRKRQREYDLVNYMIGYSRDDLWVAFHHICVCGCVCVRVSKYTFSSIQIKMLKDMKNESLRLYRIDSYYDHHINSLEYKSLILFSMMTTRHRFYRLNINCCYCGGGWFASCRFCCFFLCLYINIVIHSYNICKTKTFKLNSTDLICCSRLLKMYVELETCSIKSFI